MKPTIWGMMILILCYATQALADYDVYDARGNFIGRVKSNEIMSPSMELTQPNKAAILSVETEGGPSPWTGGVALGFAPSLTGFDTSYSLGYGLEANVGYKLNSHWAVLLMLDSYTFPSTYSGWYASQIDLMPALRYTFGEKGIRPYLFAGVGGNDDLMIEPSGLFGGLNLAVAGGLGIYFPAAPQLDLFIQGKYEYNMAQNGNFSYLPLCAGVQFN
jgi:hypothetical protein